MNMSLFPMMNHKPRWQTVVVEKALLRSKKWLLACLLPTLIFAVKAGAASSFQSDGTIVVGDYHVTLDRESGRGVQIVDSEWRQYLFTFDPKLSEGNKPATLKNKKFVVDEKNKTITCSFQAEVPGGKMLEVTNSLALTPEGRVRVSAKELSDDPAHPLLSLGGALYVRRDILANAVIAAGDKKFVFAGAPAKSVSTLKQGKMETLVLNAGNPSAQISIIPVVMGDGAVVERETELMLAYGSNGEMTYEVALPDPAGVSQSADTYSGIDFWKCNRMHMPQYNQSRNLIQNPGFEAGFAYWQIGDAHQFQGDPKYDEYYSIATEKPQSGKRALALQGEAKQRPKGVYTFAIPVEANQDYTISFYAKGEAGKAQGLMLSLQGFWQPSYRAEKGFNIGGSEWARYTFTFKTTQTLLNIGFQNNAGEQDGLIYLDSVQLEKGTQATEFTTKPVTAWVASDSRGNLWEPGKDPHATVHVSGAPGSAGKVAVKETDFFGRETDRGTLDYQLDPTGEASLPLPWAAKLPLGVHVIHLEVSAQDGFVGQDTGRLTVMRFLKNEHRNKNLFCGFLAGMQGTEKRQAEFFKHVGIGSTILFEPETHAYHKILEDNNIFHFSSIFQGGNGFKQEMGWQQHNGFNLTPEQLKQIEELSYQKAKAYPEIKYWKTFNEPEYAYPFLNDVAKVKKMMDAIEAARKGILRANPEAVIIGPDPGNMSLRTGIAWAGVQMEATSGRKTFDIPAVHPYRERPDAPDLDTETKLYLDILTAHGYHGDVWFTEGIYHTNYIVPDWKLNSYKGCSSDHYRGGAISNDMGWGERVAAAYAARSWLVGLKYSDRVKLYVDWGFMGNSSSDMDQTPRALAFAANTLGNILGNASFKADLSLGYEVHCYVFEDENKRPVAAVWYHNFDCDKGKVLGPMLDVSALTKTSPKLKYADFMGNLHALKENVQLSPFPIFIRGAKGKTHEFLDSLGKATLASDKGTLTASLEAQSATQALLQVENRANKPFKGSYQLLKGNEVVAAENLAIEAMKSWTRPVDQAIQPNTVSSSELILKLTPEGKAEATSFPLKQSAMSWPKRKTPITLTGNLQEWESAFHAPIVNRTEWPAKAGEKFPEWKGAADLSTTMYATWDEENLYLAFAVKDDVFSPSAKSDTAWNGDSVQLYFDGWADARQRREHGYGPDDQAFYIWPSLTESLVWRETAPERQLAFLEIGAVKNARIKVTRTEGTTLYEIILPVRELAPMQLKAGEKFGFAPLINDNDGDGRKRSLTLTPAESEPCAHPELYPAVILMP